MKRLSLVVILVMVLAGPAETMPQLLGQALTNSQQALQQARTAYDQGRFSEARDLAKKASETGPNNPDIYLLLGKAHYQLGELDEAMAAWNRTLVLAPKESFAKQMLEMLQSRRKDVDSRIHFVESLLTDRLDAVAAIECRGLLEDNKALSNAQRAAVLSLQADLAIRGNQPAEALKILESIQALYPKQADSIKTKLLLGEAKLGMGGPIAAEGLAILKQLATQGDTVAAASAQWELVHWELSQGVSTKRIAALAKWLTDHPNHSQADEARGELFTAYLTLSDQAAPPRPDAPLGDVDLAAISTADEIVKNRTRSEEKAAVAQRLAQHLTTRYAANKAYAAAAEGLRKLLASPLPRASRLAVRLSLYAQLKEIAIEDLRNDAQWGRLFKADAAKLPAALAAAVAALDAVRQDDPASAPWTLDVQLAGEVRAFSSGLPWPDQIAALRAPDAWMMAIALPVIKAGADPQAVAAAVGAVNGMVQECQSLGRPESWRLALDTDGQLVDALSPKSPQWPDALTARVALLDAYARQQFKRNIETGHGEKNSELSDVQNDLLDALAKLVTCDAGRADFAVQRLAEHLQPWIDGDQWPVAEAAFAALQKALPAASTRDAELAVVRFSVERVFRRDQRVLRAGLTVPRHLDSVLKQALLSLYAMQAGLPPESARLQQIRRVSDAIIGHYRGLEYDDIAEAALKARPPQAVDAADQYAEIQLLRFQDEKAATGPGPSIEAI